MRRIMARIGLAAGVLTPWAKGAAAIGAAALLAAGCAKEGFPSGGPKDETPPKVVATEPLNGSTHFEAKEFVIMFDEYVNVKDADKNILVSPPMNTKPQYGTRGRGIVVKLKDTLRSNTTYLFQFKGGIADFNEGNVLNSYEYVFSTGSSIDSMTIRGEVVDAFTHKPRGGEAAITVVAYSAGQMAEFDSVQRGYLDSLGKADTTGARATLPKEGRVGDSLVAKEKPMYMTRCDKEGRFEMNHMRAGRYMVLAYEDGDNNLLYKSEEAVAFLDTLVLSEHMPTPPDTTKADTAAADTALKDKRLQPDTLASTDTAGHPQGKPKGTGQKGRKRPQVKSVALKMSLYKEGAQRLKQAEFTQKGQITIATQLPLSEHFSLRLTDTSKRMTLFVKPNTTRDTLTVWTADKECDSVNLVLHDTNMHDTLKLTYRAPKGAAGAGKTSVGARGLAKEPSLLYSMVKPKHPYFDTLWIGFSRPVEGVADSMGDTMVAVLDLADSTTTHCGVRFVDSCRPYGHYRAMVDFEGKPGKKYQMTVAKESFIDVFGNTHKDSLTINTEYSKAEEYGNILLTLALGDDLLKAADTTLGDTIAAGGRQAAMPILIQLTNEKGEMLLQRTVTRDGKVAFEHLKGGKYGIRAVADKDGNGMWTAGDYWKHRQPEEVFYFEKTLELRENWDMEERWLLGKNAAPATNDHDATKGESKESHDE